jgi:hypothetical protein
MKKFWFYATAICFLIALAGTAQARSAYDGSWDLAFVTQRGACDPAYNFTVNVSNGVVTHPNLVRFRGYVAKSGAVRASVTVQDKHASGTGRLSGTSGRGTWSGYAGNARCSGYWTAHRNWPLDLRGAEGSATRQRSGTLIAVNSARPALEICCQYRGNAAFRKVTLQADGRTKIEHGNEMQACRGNPRRCSERAGV